MEFLIHMVNELFNHRRGNWWLPKKTRMTCFQEEGSEKNRKSSVIYVSKIEISRKKELNVLIDLLLAQQNTLKSMRG